MWVDCVSMLWTFSYTSITYMGDGERTSASVCRRPAEQVSTEVYGVACVPPLSSSEHVEECKSR